MKSLLPYIVLCPLLVSCVENIVDTQYEDVEQTQKRLCNILMTKSPDIIQEDTLKAMSRHQSDVNTLMMGRVVWRDSVFVLSIKREDALFLGVSEDIYNKYLKYVKGLNDKK